MPEGMENRSLAYEKKRKSRVEIHIIRDRCKGCGYCIEFCPKKVLTRSDEMNARGVHPPEASDENECVFCRFCADICPDFAIFVVERESGGGRS